jgi:xylan 1,4-beta-xylosidase
LFWNFTPPVTKESDQKFFKSDQPARHFGQVRVTVAGLPAGPYQTKVYRVGYQVNDVFADYLKLGLPPALTREQVRDLAAKDDGRPVDAGAIRLRAGQTFTRDVSLRENDVYLITLEGRQLR